MLAPSGSGKTAMAKAFVRAVEAKFPPTETFEPIILLSLESAATPKKFMMAILDLYKDKYSERGNEQTLKKRVKACFERKGTLILIIDEVQHLNFRLSGNNDVTDTLKRLLDDGVVPIAFLGTEEAKPIFTKNVQLSGRLIEPCDLTPLNPNSLEGRTLLGTYLAMLEREMVSLGLISSAEAFSTAWVRGCLHEVSGGVIGRVSRVVGVAFKNALYRGSDRIEVADLAKAVDTWAIPNGFIQENPFRRGPSE